MAGMETAVSACPLVECSLSAGMGRSDHQRSSDPADHTRAWSSTAHQSGLSVREPLSLWSGRTQLGGLGTGARDS